MDMGFAARNPKQLKDPLYSLLYWFSPDLDAASLPVLLISRLGIFPRGYRVWPSEETLGKVGEGNTDLVPFSLTERWDEE